MKVWFVGKHNINLVKKKFFFPLCIFPGILLITIQANAANKWVKTLKWQISYYFGSSQITFVGSP